MRTNSSHLRQIHASACLESNVYGCVDSCRHFFSHHTTSFIGGMTGASTVTAFWYLSRARVRDVFSMFYILACVIIGNAVTVDAESILGCSIEGEARLKARTACRRMPSLVDAASGQVVTVTNWIGGVL